MSLLLHDIPIICCCPHAVTNSLGLSTVPCRSPDPRKRNPSIANTPAQLLQRATSLRMGLILYYNLALTSHPYTQLSLFCCVKHFLKPKPGTPGPWLEGAVSERSGSLNDEVKQDAGLLGESSCWSPHGIILVGKDL